MSFLNYYTMKLISMTDFILENQTFNVYEANSVCNKILKYAKFLKQPLTLGMFVTCDLDGNVLEEPKEKILFVDEKGWSFKGFDELELKEYQEAKDRVLFEGFEIVKKKFNNSTYDYACNERFYVFSFWEGKWQLNNLFSGTVESLVNHGLVLTESTKKQIGL